VNSDCTDLMALADQLLDQASRDGARRAARTLPHPVDGLRQTVIALADGASLAEHESPGPASLQVLRGRARLVAGDEVVDLGPHQHAAIPPRRHALHATGDTVVLLSVALAVPGREPAVPAREPAATA
jgi:quercetin dioxygenase-like cupin family protein